MRITLFAALLACTTTLAGCIVPELDNYPADKSKGSGTTVIGEDIVSGDGSGGGGGGGGGGSCTPGTYQGTLTFNGNGASAGYNGQCTISGNVYVQATASSAEMEALQGIQSIYGQLSLAAPPSAQNLTLPNLQMVTSGITLDTAGSLQNLVLPALKSLSFFTSQNSSTIVSIDASALSDPMQSVFLAQNVVLEVVSFGTSQITSNIILQNNPALISAAFANLSSLGSLGVTGNAKLSQLQLGQGALSIVQTWQVCGNPALDPAWVTAFRAAHSNEQPCN